MKTSRRYRRTGAVLLEFAFVMPLFLLLLLAVIEFATVLFVRHAMLNAARDAVRSYSIHEFDSAGAITLATERLPAIDVGFTVSATPDSDPGIDRWVEISVPMTEASLGDPLGVLGDGDLTVRVTMRQED